MASTAHATIITESGIVGWGQDNNNVFGLSTSGGFEDLGGQAFVLSISVDTSQYTSFDNVPGHYQWASGYSVPVFASLTINGITDSFSGTGSGKTGLSTPLNGQSDIYQFVNADYSAAQAEVSSFYDYFLSSTDYNQVLSYTPTFFDYQYANFVDAVSGVNMKVEGGLYHDAGSVTNLTFNGSNSIPEPTTIALLSFGLVNLAVTRRRTMRAR